MTDTTRLIKKHIEEKYGSPSAIEIGNCSEINFSLKGKTVYQYIIGVTKGDPMGNGIYHYESHMQNQLKDISEGITTLGWSFEVEELGEIQTTLAELSEYFDITMDIEKMIKSLRVGDYQGLLYIAITVVPVTILAGK